MEEEFTIPDGMTPEEATREMISRDAEKYGIKQLPQRKKIKLRSSKKIEKVPIAHQVEREENNQASDINLWKIIKEICANNWKALIFGTPIFFGILLIILGSFLEGSFPEVNPTPLINSIQSFFGWIPFLIGFIVFFVCIALFFSLFGDTVYTGPRGGKYRINSKGRKSYDVK